MPNDTCAWCLGAVQLGQRFCSQRHYERHKARTQTVRNNGGVGQIDGYGAVLATLTCELCGQHIERAKNGRAQKRQRFCKPCVEADPTTAARGRNIRARLHGQAGRRVGDSVPCSECGTAAVFAGGNIHRCDACADLQRRDLNRRKNMRRRAATGAGRDYTLKLLLERTSGRCVHCRRKVKPDAPVTHPLKATVDHIVPISQGGEDCAANVQLACRRCNCAKGARTMPNGEQLRLIG